MSPGLFRRLVLPAHHRSWAETERVMLNNFFDAAHQLASVDLWLDSQLADLHARAEARRTECRAKAGAALADMRNRGLTFGEIARMSGMPEETLRGYMDELI
jgi:hypothetical protein